MIFPHLRVNQEKSPLVGEGGLGEWGRAGRGAGGVGDCGPKLGRMRDSRVGLGSGVGKTPSLVWH